MFTSLIPFVNNRAISNASEGWLNDPFVRAFFNNDVFSAMPQMKVDVQDRGKDYLMEVELPGVKQEEIDLSLEDGVMTIKAEMNGETKEEKSDYLFRERRTGHLERRFNVEGIDEASITAAFKDGVLSIVLPKMEVKEEEKVRKIRIGTADEK